MVRESRSNKSSNESNLQVEGPMRMRVGDRIALYKPFSISCRSYGEWVKKMKIRGTGISREVTPS
jgi:hypothetical protein